MVDPKEKAQQSRQEILDGISAYQEKLRQRRQTKVTPESLQRTLDERKAARAEKVLQQEPGTRSRRIRVVAAVALLVATGAVALGIDSSNRSFEAESNRNEQTIAELRDDLATVKDEQMQPEQTKTLETQLRTARAKADQVATLQQEFAVLMRQAGLEKTSGNGVPGKSFLAAVEHRRDLAPYFDRDSYVVEGDAAYQPNSTTTFEPDEIDPRYPWYVRYETGAAQHRAASSSTYAWKAVSVTSPDDADPSRFDVTWLCEGRRTGQPLAWATARYDIESETFNNLSVGTTTLGDRYTQGN